jgi:hypothetical protein
MLDKIKPNIFEIPQFFPLLTGERKTLEGSIGL